MLQLLPLDVSTGVSVCRDLFTEIPSPRPPAFTETPLLQRPLFTETPFIETPDPFSLRPPFIETPLSQTCPSQMPLHKYPLSQTPFRGATLSQRPPYRDPQDRDPPEGTSRTRSDGPMSVTDGCENITFSQLRWWAVKKKMECIIRFIDHLNKSSII